MAEQLPRLEMTNIVKEFPGVKALSDVQLRLYPGEVHALMGENGAGKSTLIKVLTGVYPIDQGTVTLEGNPVHISSPLKAQEHGITTVYQEVNLCSNLSVTENIFIGREIKKYGRLAWKEMHQRAEKLLERLQLKIDVTKLLSSYSVAIQQMVAIARALNVSAKILILDEPTSSLDRDEVQQLFAVMRQLKKDGLAIVFVSHFLDQIFEITDRLTVLRNGEWIGEYKTAEISRMDLVSKMIGKELEEMEAISSKNTGNTTESTQSFLQADEVGLKGKVEPFDLEMRKGEIVGLAGLLGSGRTEMARVLFGADKKDKGKIKVNGKEAHFSSPRNAILYKIGFCSENRKTEGIIPELTVRENMILAIQSVYGWFRYLSKAKQMKIADEYIQLLNINPANPEQLIKNLSGGNQQKVMLARWLVTDPDLLILDEPTRGIDIGAKTEIMKLMTKLSKENKSILFISSEIEEILRTCDRIAVLRDRKKVKEFDNDGKLTQQDVMKEMAGGG
ncbi:simple sugar transport system ATP-binding protein [Gracilibacillus ureilyticus]|uniref:Simple sugar transport system ATP-binding protein n=1 Tax=Gracilibacillus ureilyticus TaxID=531814 RepID=A0A1H9R8W3_9BACI|nr:sugar ABC transporter ATP-binding protein [Gracilibacillus ureilyticus]SER69047.1 simple sugar transport system ATP-binding protein [Gracilibacillus ureilyticus]